MSNKNILLIEPEYKNKYPPLGLMKIAQYHGENGKNDNVVFIKGEDKKVFAKAWDRIYITTLFSFEWLKIAKSIDYALKVVNGDTNKIFVGGIAASLMHEKFTNDKRWQGIRFIKGLLNKSPAESLQLDEFSEELYSDDWNSTPIEDLIPDYSILDQIDYKYPVRDAYFAYTSRGCIRKCHFCGVPKLEGAQVDVESLTYIVNGINELYGEKKDLTLMDNNVVASPNFKNIIAEIRDLGFQAGATLKRNGVRVKRRVDFNQGVDARILCKDPMYLRELSTISLKPLRIAFDHLGVRKSYEQAIRYAHDYGLDELSNYMLYNFHDSPKDLFERMRLNVTLNEELNIRIYSFPMRYQPTDLPDRSHIGEKWSKYYLRSFQIIMHATHGIVSGNPEFFKVAFGDTYEDFEMILMLPHKFIFNRMWYEKLGGRNEYDEYFTCFNKLSKDKRVELIEILSSVNQSQYKVLNRRITDKNLKNIICYYYPIPKENERVIWDKQKFYKDNNLSKECIIPEDELVEDAGSIISA
ncbi:MAG: radical SAM protein [Proteobacteria bacterium]|nr:radical SAM protein [Pseudomonadota bacterium]